MKTLLKCDFLYFKKTSKWIILGLLSLFLSALSVLTARYMQELLRWAMEQEGIGDVEFPPPTVFTAYEQYFSNILQIFLLVVVFIALAMFTQDRHKGYATFFFAKPIKRSHYLFSKALSMSVIVLATLLLGGLIFGYYAYYLFDAFHPLRFLGALLSVYVFTMFIVHVGLLASVLSKQFLKPLLATIGIFFLFSLLSMVKGGIFTALPNHLMNTPFEILSGDIGFLSAFTPVAATLGLIAALLFTSVYLFQKQNLV